MGPFTTQGLFSTYRLTISSKVFPLNMLGAGAGFTAVEVEPTALAAVLVPAAGALGAASGAKKKRAINTSKLRPTQVILGDMYLLWMSPA